MTLFLHLISGSSSPVLNVLLGNLSVYFEKYYALAVGIAMCGISLGIMISAPLTQFLLDMYGWRGTILIWAAFCSHFVISGALLAPKSAQDSPKRAKRKTSDVARPKVDHTALKLRDYNLPTLSGDVVHPRPDRTASKLREYNPPTISEKEQEAQYSTVKKSRYIVKYLDLSLFTEYSFIVLAMLVGCMTYSLTGWLIYIVPYALSEDISPYQASYLATGAGISNLISKLATPVLQKKVPNRVVLYITLIMQALSLVATGMLKVYGGILAASIMYGIAIGIFTVAYYVGIHQVAGRDRAVNALTWTSVFNSVFSILSGWSTGN